MTPRPGRRTAALVAGLGLAAGSLLVAPVAPASAAPENDSDAAMAAADWLVGELNAAGLLENAQFGGPSYGLTIDAGLSLAELEGTAYDAQLTETTDALTTQQSVDAYTTFDYTFDGVRYAGTAAGATGKLLAFAVSRGVDPADVSGVDLQQRMEDQVTRRGRIADGDETGNNEDFANNISQTWAARGLTEAGSAAADSATGFLLSQQCAAGFVPEGFGTGAQRACDPAADDPSIDATAYFVLNLAATDPADGSDVADAIDDAAGWLEDQQAGNGSIGGDNTNSTGLAGWALATNGNADAAEDAAAHVAGKQVAGLTACEGELTPDEDGALALSRTTFERDTETGIDNGEKRDQWRVATAQALPVLRSLPVRTEGGTLATGSARYVKAGGTTRLRVGGLAAGQKDCVVGGGGATTVVGSGQVAVDVPGGTANRTYRLVGAGETVTVRALGAKRLTVVRKNTVARGGTQTVTVRGLAPQEDVRVVFRGRRVVNGTANGQGVFRGSFTVTGTKGRAPLKVTGQFPATRSGSNGFTVR